MAANSGWRGNRKPIPVVVVGTEVAEDIVTSSYTLLSNAASTGDYVEVRGGTYVWDAVGTFGGATLQLQTLGSDGTTDLDIEGAELTANGNFESPVLLGDGTQVRVEVTGSPTGIYSTLRVA